MDREAESRGTRAEHMARAGALLWEAWRERRQIDALPADCRPGTLADAYAVQDGLAESAGLAVAGYKIGATNAQVQARFGVDAPFSGRLFARLRGREPAHRAREHRELLRDRGGVRLRHGPGACPRATRPTRAEAVRAAVASVHPAIEVPDSRYTDWLSMKAPDLIGDNAIGCLLCLGPPAEGGLDRDLAGPAGDRPRERRGGERGRGLQRPRRPVERHGLARQPPRRQGPHARGRPRGDHRQRGGRGAVPAGRYGDRRVRAHRQGRGPLRGVGRMSALAMPLHRHARTCSGHLLRSGSPAGGCCIPRARPCGRVRRGWPERVRP